MAEMTGTLRARNGAEFVWIFFRDGEITAVESLEQDGLDALVKFGEWSDGRFDFVSGAPAVGSAPRPFEWMMLEVCRRLDEARMAAAS